MDSGVNTRTQKVLCACIAAGLLVGFVYLSINILRLAYIVNIAHFVLILNMLVLGSIVLVGAFNWRHLKVTRVEWLLLSILALVALTTDYTNRATVDIAVDVLRPLLFIGVIVVVRSLLDITSFSNSPIIRRLLAGTVWVTLGAVIGCYAVNIWIQNTYTAFSTIDSILGLGWLIAAGTLTGPLAFWALLFLSGKRMVYLAGLMLLLMLYRKNKHALLSIVLVTAAATLASNYIGPEDVSFIAKSSRVHMDIEIASGGRLHEIRDAWAAQTGLRTYLIGEGFGFSYYSKVFAEQSGEMHRNVHFTPLSIFMYYGGIFLMLFCWAMLRIAKVAWHFLHDQSNPVLFSYSAYFLASLLFALSEYSIFVYANFAIACGIILAAAREKQSFPPADKTV